MEKNISSGADIKVHKDKLESMFENEELKVIFHKGSSDFLVITFGDLLSPADGLRFFADSAIRKKDITCLGFMSKKPTWYPEKSMHLAINSIKSILADFSEIVTYGGSMGGYASIKYSGQLSATTVLALCPQWTIDPNECNGKNPGYKSFFEESMAGMGIKKEDISGKVFIFYDPTHEEDTYHGSHIIKNYTDCHHISMRSVGHHVTRVLAGTENLNLLIKNAITSNYENLKSQASRLRRSSVQRKKAVLFSSIQKHPFILQKIITQQPSAYNLNESDIKNLHSRLLEEFVSLESHQESLLCIEQLKKLELCENRLKLLESTETLIRRKAEIKSVIVNTHGKMLAYDMTTGQLIQTPLFKRDLNILLQPVTISQNISKEILCIKVAGKEKLLLLNNKQNIIIADPTIGEACKELTLTISRKTPNNKFNICIGKKFMTCEPVGNIKYDREEAKGWEEFSEIIVQE